MCLTRYNFDFPNGSRSPYFESTITTANFVDINFVKSIVPEL